MLDRSESGPARAPHPPPIETRERFLGPRIEAGPTDKPREGTETTIHTHIYTYFRHVTADNQVPTTNDNCVQSCKVVHHAMPTRLAMPAQC